MCPHDYSIDVRRRQEADRAVAEPIEAKVDPFLTTGMRRHALSQPSHLGTDAHGGRRAALCEGRTRCAGQGALSVIRRHSLDHGTEFQIYVRVCCALIVAQLRCPNASVRRVPRSMPDIRRWSGWIGTEFTASASMFVPCQKFADMALRSSVWHSVCLEYKFSWPKALPHRDRY